MKIKLLVSVTDALFSATSI